jgi:hypothetical protein
MNMIIFDEIPPFSIGFKSIPVTDNDGTNYLRSDHEEVCGSKENKKKEILM